MTEEEDHFFAGKLDQRLRKKYGDQWIPCPKGHLNSPNAEVCWKCGRPIERALCEEKRERLFEAPRSDI